MLEEAIGCPTTGWHGKYYLGKTSTFCNGCTKLFELTFHAVTLLNSVVICLDVIVGNYSKYS